MNKYQCDSCDKWADDLGPYETPSGDYICQDCMEGRCSTNQTEVGDE